MFIITKPRVQLRPLAWRLLWISGVFNVSIALSNTFVNIFVWKVDHSYTAIAEYNLFVYILIPVVFVLALMLSTRIHVGWAMRFGILGHACFYAITLVIGERAAHVPMLLGTLMGIAAGFYWFAFNKLSMEYTGDGERDRFFGFNGVLTAVAGIVAPPISGFLITEEDRFGGLSGYHLIFGISFACFLAALYLSFRLKAHTLPPSLSLGHAFRCLQFRKWRDVMLGCCFYGLREGVFLFLIGLLFYVATGSELSLGQFFLLQNALSFLVFFTVGRLTKKQNRLNVMGIGAAGMAIAACSFFFPMKSGTILIYGALIAITLPAFLIPLQGFVYDGISELDEQEDRQAAHLVMREVFENVGRVVGIGLFLLLASAGLSTGRLSAFVIVIGMVQLATWGVIYLGRRHQKPSGGGQERLPKEARQELRRNTASPG